MRGWARNELHAIRYHLWTLLWPLFIWFARRHRGDEVSNVKRILEAERSSHGAPAA